MSPSKNDVFVDAFAALANLVNLKKLRIEEMGLDLTGFDDHARHLKPLANLDELSLELDELWYHSNGTKFVHLISTMFPNVTRFDLKLSNDVSIANYNL